MVRNPVYTLMLMTMLSGCGLISDWTGWKTIERIALQLHAPPQVKAGTPFSIYADYDTACGVDDTIAVTVNDAEKTLRVTITQRIQINRACPASFSPRRTSGTVVVNTAGTYRVIADAQAILPSESIEVLPEGGVPAPWTPPPLRYQ